MDVLTQLPPKYKLDNAETLEDESSESSNSLRYVDKRMYRSSLWLVPYLYHKGNTIINKVLTRSVKESIHYWQIPFPLQFTLH